MKTINKNRIISLIVIVLCFSSLVRANTLSVDENIRNIFESNYSKFEYGYKLYELYRERGFKSIWVSSDKYKDLSKTFELAVYDGLTPTDYLIWGSQFSFEQRTNEYLADLDIQFTNNYLKLLDHLSNGKIDPSRVDPNWHLKKAKKDVSNYLQVGIEKGSEYGVALIHRSDDYLKLQNELVKYIKIRNEGNLPKLSYTKVFKKGDINSQIISIKKVLSAFDNTYLSDKDISNIYNENLYNAVKLFQKQHGLHPDGVLGKATFTELAVSIDKRIQQIVVNMERLRWLPEKESDYYILINIPDYKLKVIKNGNTLIENKVIVGQTKYMTPVFASRMSYLVFNPGWVVPHSIIERSIIPRAISDSTYFTKRGITIMKYGDTIDYNEVDWVGVEPTDYDFIMETSGNNPLGDVKFMFPNQFEVYIHDTPNKWLFSKDVRAFSSGCIRTDNALRLAEILLNNYNYRMSDIKEIVTTDDFTKLTLREMPYVYILYLTAWVDEWNQLNFRHDIYGLDKEINKFLRFTLDNEI